MTRFSYLKVLILFLIPIIFILLIGRFGLEDSDSGFIVGLGWRIFNGELPYKDFFYVRPPLSPYISAFYLWLTPNYGQVLFLRLINNYQLLFQVFLSLAILKKDYNFSKLNIDIYGFSALCYFITLSGTLYFQWHTTDGVFLAVLGIFLVYYFENNKFIYFFSGILFCASMLTKQNFMIIPFVSISLIFLQKGFLKSFIVFLGLISGLILFYSYLKHFNLVSDYLSLTSGASNLRDLFIAGFAFYFIKHEYLFLYFSTVTFCSLFFLYFKRKSSLLVFKLDNQVIIFFLSLSILFLFSVTYVFLFESRERVIAYDRVLPVLVILSFIYLLISSKELIKNHYTLLTLLSISWSSSISWGGMTPIMYFTPIVFLTYYILKSHTKCLSNRNLNKVFFLIIIIFSIIQAIVPYRNGFFWKSKNDGGLLSDKLAFIKVDDSFYEKHLEYKSLVIKYSNSTTLPSMPGSSYLYSKNNPFIMDWSMDVESNYKMNELVENIKNCCHFVIVEKRNLGQPIGTSGKFYSSITSYVQDNFKLIDESNFYFDVYKVSKNN